MARPARKADSPTRQRPRLDHEYGPIRARLRYLCEFLFGGSHAEMARTLNVDPRHFYFVIRDAPDHGALTVRMAAQIVSRLGVNAEWFLTGSGPVFVRDDFPETAALNLPLAVQSSFKLAEPIETTPPELPFTARRLATGLVSDEPPAMYSHAALSIFSANSQRCPVMLLLGSDGVCEQTGELVAPFFRDAYVHFLGVSLAAAREDAHSAITAGYFDLNHAAVLAANAGIGYGEAVATWAYRDKLLRQQSALALVYDAGAPVAMFAEIGEVPEHTTRALRGAEIGAAVGAAAYVDQLVFTEYCQLFRQAGGGVIICAGELHRWSALIARTFAAQADLHISVVAASRQQPEIDLPNIQVCRVDDSPPAFFQYLLSACRAVYTSGGAAVT